MIKLLYSFSTHSVRSLLCSLQEDLVELHEQRKRSVEVAAGCDRNLAVTLIHPQSTAYPLSSSPSPSYSFTCPSASSPSPFLYLSFRFPPLSPLPSFPPSPPLTTSHASESLNWMNRCRANHKKRRSWNNRERYSTVQTSANFSPLLYLTLPFIPLPSSLSPPPSLSSSPPPSPLLFPSSLSPPPPSSLSPLPPLLLPSSLSPPPPLLLPSPLSPPPPLLPLRSRRQE